MAISYLDKASLGKLLEAAGNTTDKAYLGKIYDAMAHIIISLANSNFEIKMSSEMSYSTNLRKVVSIAFYDNNLMFCLYFNALTLRLCHFTSLDYNML